MPVRTPSVEIAGVACDAQGQAVEVNEMTANGSAYIIRYEVNNHWILQDGTS